jgi:hypothetical protein
MTPDQKKTQLEGAIAELQRQLSSLEDKLRNRSRALGFVGEKLQKLEWAPEVHNLLPQIFSWNSPGEGLVEEIADSLFLREGSVEVGRATLSYVKGRLWISALQFPDLLEVIGNWSLQVEDHSHAFEKLQGIRGQVDYLDDYLLELFPLREVP